jgi:hypothetical protein
MSAHEALISLAQDLVTEMAAGLAVELAGQPGGQGFSPSPPPAMATQLRNPVAKGPAAVHPQLGSYLARLPGDAISGHAYQHLGMHAPGT